MVVEIINKKTKHQLYLADIVFGLDVLFVKSYDSVCDSLQIKNNEDLTQFLQKRAEIQDNYKQDMTILKKLNLDNRQHEFGRMSAACVLYALLNNFEQDNDNIAIYPITTQLVSMVEYDPCYGNIYIWESRNDTE